MHWAVVWIFFIVAFLVLGFVTKSKGGPNWLMGIFFGVSGALTVVLFLVLAGWWDGPSFVRINR